MLAVFGHGFARGTSAGQQGGVVEQSSQQGEGHDGQPRASPVPAGRDNGGMSRFARAEVERVLELVRAACLPLPTVTERLSHGGPAFFVGTRSAS